MKFKPGLKILLYLPKNSTVFTVFGVTTLVDNDISIISKIIDGTIPGIQ
ncbi:hypothetical protein GW891_01425 [bacterium]|nr:hypothetical protein [bacterium]